MAQDKGLKQVLGLAVILIAGFMVYNYWKKKGSPKLFAQKKPATPPPSLRAIKEAYIIENATILLKEKKSGFRGRGRRSWIPHMDNIGVIYYTANGEQSNPAMTNAYQALSTLRDCELDLAHAYVKSLVDSNGQQKLQMPKDVQIVFGRKIYPVLLRAAKAKQSVLASAEEDRAQSDKQQMSTRPLWIGVKPPIQTRPMMVEQKSKAVGKCGAKVEDCGCGCSGH